MLAGSRPRIAATGHYREDIQGLRAVAALLVAVYHIWMGRVSGGVDVFFVVSGYLMTRSLLGGLERTGQVEPLAFWAGLARRLLPAALVVLTAIVVAGLLWLPQVHWERTIKEVVASTLYLENWYLAWKQVDYLDRDGFVSPLQHFWALSLQGQIYVAWPLLLAGAALVARRAGRVARDGVLALALAVFSLSLVYSIVTTAVRQPFAYFDTLARCWEFALGAAVASLGARAALPARWRAAAGWVGLAAILSCGLLLPVARAFPGYAALWPTVAGVLILLAAPEPNRWGADRLLAARPLAALGDASYAIYLWHWPIFVFYRVLTGETTAGIVDGIAIIAISVALALLTTRVAERPLRRSAALVAQPIRTFGVAALGVVLVMGLTGTWGLVYANASRGVQPEVPLDDPHYPGAAALEGDLRAALSPSAPVLPAPLAIRQDLPRVYRDGCQASERREAPLSCTYGDPRGRPTIALVGGSHSTQWLPALRRIAEAHGWRIVTYLKDMCRLDSAPARTNTGQPYPGCDRWRARVMRELQALRPDAVFTTATYAGEGRETVPAGFLPMWRQLERSGILVLAIRDTPYPGFNVPECVEVHGPTAARCGRRARDVLEPSNPARRLAPAFDRVRLLEMTRYFCPGERCPAVIGNLVVYRDDNHVSRAYMRTLAPMLEGELRRAVPEFFAPRHARGPGPQSGRETDSPRPIA